MRSIREICAQVAAYSKWYWANSENDQQYTPPTPRAGFTDTGYVTKLITLKLTMLTTDALNLPRLFNFTTALHKKLPRELRDMIYTHLFDLMEPTHFIAMAASVGPKVAQGAISHGNKVRDRWPRVIRPSVVDYDFARELVKAFHEQYEGTTVVDARSIYETLTTDFFRLGVRLRECILPAFAVCIHLDDTKPAWPMPPSCAPSPLLPTLENPQRSWSINPLHVADCFAPLLSTEQRLARGFKLVILLHSSESPALFYAPSLNGWEFRDPSRADLITGTIWRIIWMLHTCKPIIAQLKQKCQADVRIGLKLGAGEDMEVGEEHMDLGMDEWVAVLNGLQ